MKNYKLIRAIGEIDPELIEEAESGAKKEKRQSFGFAKWGAVAAAAVLAMTAVVLTVGSLDKREPVADPSNSGIVVPGGVNAGGDTVWGGADIPGSSDETDPDSGNTDPGRRVEDKLGVIVIGGEKFIQTGVGNKEGYTKKDYLGKASSFEGEYRSEDFGIDGDVYSVNENDDAVIIFLDNDGVVTLKRSSAID